MRNRYAGSRYLSKPTLEMLNNLCQAQGREACLSEADVAALPDDALFYPIFPVTFEHHKEKGEVEVRLQVIVDRQQRRHILLDTDLATFNSLPEVVSEPPR